ncbi:hypothetical protein MycrhDRAFT_0945 [Mycolicibacterium rhodesiae JS60]|nr:hypothetical protein MycrhDRAFT_0945 [Mycolicibacterium rhodesiae JS60]
MTVNAARRSTGVLTLAMGMMMSLTSHASADPTQYRYPDTSGYQPVLSVWIYKATDESGVWMTTPLGIRCAIEDDGSYGCSGPLAGVPAGENEVAWFAGDPYPRLYRTDTPRFSANQGQAIVSESTFIDYHGSRCAVTYESAVYCKHNNDPNSQMMVTSATVLRGADASPAL